MRRLLLLLLLALPLTGCPGIDDDVIGDDDDLLPNDDDATSDDDDATGDDDDATGDDDDATGDDDDATGGACTPIGTLICGAEVTIDTTTGTNAISSYSCETWDESGPEVAWTFSPGNEDVTITLGESLDADHDIFVLPDASGCDPDGCIASGDVEASFTTQVGETYWIVVDGYLGDAGFVDLTVTCGPIGDDDDATGDDDDSAGDDDDSAGDDDDSTGDDDDSASANCGGGTTSVGNFNPLDDAAVGAFCAAGYDTVEGDVLIDSTLITDLSSLSCLCEVTGNFTYEGTTLNLTTSAGLEGLATVGGDFTVTLASTLFDWTGFDGLTDVGGNFSVNNNSSLGGPGVSGLSDVFPALTNVTGNFGLTNNPGMLTFDGFGSLLSVGGNVTITGNSSLTELQGFEALTTVGGDMTVSSNSGLNDITAFSGNSALSVTGNFTMNANQGAVPLSPALTGFDALISVGGDFTYTSNGAFQDVSGFDQLFNVGGDVTFEFNVPNLNAITGLGVLNTIGGDLLIGTNTLLSNVSGLMAIDTVGGDFTVQWNALLPTASAEALRDAIGTSDIGGTVTIQGNLP